MFYSGRASDVWSVGVTLFMMAFGRLPVDGETQGDILDNIISERCARRTGSHRNARWDTLGATVLQRARGQ